MQKTIEISTDELDLVKAKIAKANKKAAALGVSPVVIDSVVQFTKRIPTKGNEYQYEQFLRVDLSYETLKLGEYTFVAALDHTVGKNPIVNAVPEQLVPEQYFTTASRCDHCGTDRFRKQTFLFKDAQGYKLVGRSCLKDFFGVDPTKSLAWLHSIGGIGEGLGVRGERVAPIVDIIAVGLVLSKRYGYVTSKQAEAYFEKSNGESSIQTTADKVRFSLFVPLVKAQPDEVEYRRQLMIESQLAAAQARELIKWALEHFGNENSSYAHNMRQLLAVEAVGPRYVGYVVSAIAAYNREVEKHAFQKVVAKSNEYVGSVGDKLAISVTVLKHSAFDTDYGTTHLFVMADAAGNSLVWFASNNVLEVGETITLKGTVKAQNDRDGRKQTVLTRCKVQ